jgi:hypothetical protein
MKVVKILLYLAGILLLNSAPGLCVLGQNATNGVYGGYVGSDKWFTEMRKTAANQALMQSLAGTRDPRKIPEDYVEFAGQIVFPDGNPFPDGRLPDLRIICRNQDTDSVERAPFLDGSSFYTVLRKGQTYDLYWMYYFGSKEKFASVSIRPDGPKQRQCAIEYRPNTSTDKTPSNQTYQKVDNSKLERREPPGNVDQFDLSGFPRQATNFEEQQVMEEVKFANNPALKAKAHERLARYYERKGDSIRANAERAKAKYWQEQ